mgnify:CR=1 FL=1
MGYHKISETPNFMYNGEMVTPQKVTLQTAKTLLQFQAHFLLKNPVTLTGKERIVDEFSKVNKLANYNSKNLKILSELLKFGSVSEYVFVNKKGYIDSKIIPADEGTPVYNQHNEMIAFIQSYVFDGIGYYTVFEEDVVKEYKHEGEAVHLIGQHANLSGLPIHYHSKSEYSEVEGRSALDDFMNLLDDMEMLLSKTLDATYTYFQGIPVLSGQRLNTANGIPKEIVGGGLVLDDGATFEFVSNELDIKAFEVLYDKLNQQLLDVSATPAVSMNRTDVTNLSETSIRLLFSLAEVKASENEQYMREGMLERYERVRKLLAYRGIDICDDEFATLDLLFKYNRPSNDKEQIDNLKTLREIDGISVESMLERNPYVNDVAQEIDRMEMEGMLKEDVRVDVTKENIAENNWGKANNSKDNE